MKETILTMIKCIQSMQDVTDDIHNVNGESFDTDAWLYNEELKRMRNTPIMQAYYRLAQLPNHISRDECVLIARIFCPDLCTCTREALIEILKGDK